MNHGASGGRGGLVGDHVALTGQIIDAGIEVHRALGPGLLESTYEHCLMHELIDRGIAVRRQVALPIQSRGQTLDAGYRLDLLVDERVIVEIKASEAITALHRAQVHTYLKLSGMTVALLMNFNVVLFKTGLKRIVR